MQRRRTNWVVNSLAVRLFFIYNTHCIDTWPHNYIDKMNEFTKHLTPGCMNYLLWVHLRLTTSLGHEMLNKEERKCAFLALLSYQHSLYHSPPLCLLRNPAPTSSFNISLCVTLHSPAKWLRATYRPNLKYIKLSFLICKTKIIIIPPS